MTSATLPNSDQREMIASDRHTLLVCTGENCANAGAKDLLKELEHECQHRPAGVRVGKAKCLRRCQLAPAMVEDGRVLGWMSLRRLKFELARLGLGISSAAGA